MKELSPSKLNLFNECPRCFWLQENKNVKRPRGAFPTLPGGMDGVMKKYFDTYLGSLPPELVGEVPEGLVLFSDAAKLKSMRHWKTGPRFVVPDLDVEIRGALDHLLVDPITDMYYPLDFKTKGWMPKDDGSQYYGTQIDCYSLQLAENGYAPGGAGFLAYSYPVLAENRQDNGHSFLDIVFTCKVFQLEAKPERALAVIKAAIDCLAGPMPEPGENEYGPCDYCTFAELRAK